MQADNDRAALGPKLDSLRTADIAPGWDKAAAWQRLESMEKAGLRKKTIALRTAKMAAAAALIAFCFFALRPGNPGVAEWAGTVIPPAAKPGRQPALVSIPAEIAPKSHQLPYLPPPKRPAVAAAQTSAGPAAAQEEQLVTNEPPLIPGAGATVAADTPPHLPKSGVRHAPPVVYTLNEIMADLPEREAPPKRYSGIFHHRSSSADVPAHGTPGRRSGSLPDDGISAEPEPIN